MDLFSAMKQFPTQEACIAHLEKARWGDTPACPLCGSVGVARKQENYRVGRWNCHACKSSFNVLSGTIFSRTKVPLQKWFVATAILVNAKKSVSAHQLARDLELNVKTAWYLAMRIRRAMAQEEYSYFLRGIVEADETYVGGRPRKTNTGQSTGHNRWGRGTDKTPVIGAVERGGRVIADTIEYVDSWTIRKFLLGNIYTDGSTLITDQFPSYRPMKQHIEHLTVDHGVQYVDGMKHTNTIEGFWSLLKRAWLGTHHHYTRKWTVAYVAEAAFKYNMRKTTDSFERLIGIAIKAENW